MATVSFANDIAPTLFKYRGQMAWRLGKLTEVVRDIPAQIAVYKGSTRPAARMISGTTIDQEFNPFVVTAVLEALLHDGNASGVPFTEHKIPIYVRRGVFFIFAYRKWGGFKTTEFFKAGSRSA